MTSVGFVTIRTLVSGAYSEILPATLRIISEFFCRRSMRVIPGFLGRPALTTTISEPAKSWKSLLPETSMSIPHSEIICVMSRASPWGNPWIISTRRRSHIPFIASWWATAAPIRPEPSMLTNFLAFGITIILQIQVKHLCNKIAFQLRERRVYEVITDGVSGSPSFRDDFKESDRPLASCPIGRDSSAVVRLGFPEYTGTFAEGR